MKRVRERGFANKLKLRGTGVPLSRTGNVNEGMSYNDAEMIADLTRQLEEAHRASMKLQEQMHLLRAASKSSPMPSQNLYYASDTLAAVQKNGELEIKVMDDGASDLTVHFSKKAYISLRKLLRKPRSAGAEDESRSDKPTIG